MSERPWLESYPPDVPKTLEPFPSRSLSSILAESASRFPSAPAVAFWLPGAPMGKTISYGDLVTQVDQFGRVLTSLGVTKGDAVGLVLPNCPQYVIAYYAALRIGAVIVGNNPLYTERELTHQLTDSGIGVVVTLDVLYPKVQAVRDAVGLREVVVGSVTDFMPFPLNLLAPRTIKKHELAAGNPWPPVPAGAKVRWWKDVMKASYP